MLLVALAKYPGVAVLRPVSADSVPYVDLHLQVAVVGNNRDALCRTDLQCESRCGGEGGRCQSHRLATRLSSKPRALQSRSAHRRHRRRTSEETRARGG